MSTQPVTPQMGPHPAMLDMVKISWKWMMFLGIVLVLAGGVAIAIPAAISVSMTIFIGILLLVGALVHAIRIFSWHGWGHFFLSLIMAVVYLAAGLMILAYPLSGTITLTLLLGIFFIVQGAFKIAVSLAQRKEIQNWSWLLVDGIVALILGLLIWESLPSSAAWAIGLLLGVYLLFDGVGLIVLSWMIRGGGPKTQALA